MEVEAEVVQTSAVEIPMVPVVPSSGDDAPRKTPCPYCGSRESRVRRTAGATRYRWCERCGRNYSTYEVVRKE
jgi:hypothetical protein